MAGPWETEELVGLSVWEERGYFEWAGVVELGRGEGRSVVGLDSD